MGENNLQKLAKNEMIEHFDYDAKKQIGFCKSCVGGKLHCNLFKRSGRRTIEQLELVH